MAGCETLFVKPRSDVKRREVKIEKCATRSGVRSEKVEDLFIYPLGDH